MKVISFNFLLSAVVLISSSLTAQTTLPPTGEVFRDDVIPRIDILLPADSLAVLYTPGEEWRNHHYHSTFIFDNGTVRDTLENVGFRFRGNTSRTSEKKSFKISFNTYSPGRKYYGLEKMNLNGEHNDPTVMRAKLCWDLWREMGVVGARSNHIRLYINDDFYGLYINVEHIDEEFAEERFGNKDGNLYKCLWPADLDYKGADPNLYKENLGSRRTYDLRTNTEEDDYSDLAHFIDVLNNTPTAELSCELEKVFNIDDYLKHIALDLATGNWDGPLYNKNNFYLYHNTASGKFEYIPYDLDNTLGIDWLNRDWGNRNIYDWSKHDEPRPLYWRLMEVVEYRDRFSYYMSQLETDFFNEDHLFSRIDELIEIITPYVIADPYRSLDYGFTFQDYLSSFTVSLDQFHTPYGLKPYISTRIAANNSQIQINNIHPIIKHIENNHPTANQDIHINAAVIDDGSLAQVLVCYSIGDAPVTCVPMQDDGLHTDHLADDGIYSIILPALGQTNDIHYFIEATDNAGLYSRQPRCENKDLTIEQGIYPLYINEFMASNNTTITDEAGEYDDWVELYYNGNEPLYLGDKYLSDNASIPNKWAMPDTSIAPGEHLLFWADNDEEQGVMHTNFKLSANGEFIGIFDNQTNGFALIDGLDFGEQQTDIPVGRIPDGTGAFQQVIATPEAMNQVLSSTHPMTMAVGRVELKTYPNPVRDYLTIECISEFNTKQWTAELVSPLGQRLTSFKLATGINSLSVHELGLPAGVYFLRLLNEFDEIEVIKKLIFL